MLEHLLELERDWFLSVNGSHTWWLDQFMYAFASMWIWFPLLLVPLYFAFRRRDEWKPMFICTVLTIALNLIVTSLLFKPYFMRFRPTHHPLFKDIVVVINDYIESGCYGFISGHSTNAFAFAVLSSLVIKNNWYSVPIFIWAVIMVYSRVYLGAHFISDVIPGMFMGILLGWLLYLLYKFMMNKRMPV